MRRRSSPARIPFEYVGHGRGRRQHNPWGEGGWEEPDHRRMGPTIARKVSAWAKRHEALVRQIDAAYASGDLSRVGELESEAARLGALIEYTMLEGSEIAAEDRGEPDYETLPGLEEQLAYVWGGWLESQRPGAFPHYSSFEDVLSALEHVVRGSGRRYNYTPRRINAASLVAAAKDAYQRKLDLRRRLSSGPGVDLEALRRRLRRLPRRCLEGVLARKKTPWERRLR